MLNNQRIDRTSIDVAVAKRMAKLLLFQFGHIVTTSSGNAHDVITGNPVNRCATRIYPGFLRSIVNQQRRPSSSQRQHHPLRHEFDVEASLRLNVIMHGSASTASKASTDLLDFILPNDLLASRINFVTTMIFAFNLTRCERLLATIDTTN